MKRDNALIEMLEKRDQFQLDLKREKIVDLFAGGGGLSEAIEIAFGTHVDYAANHDDDAISMHTANHPQTIHLKADVREVCPRAVAQGSPIGLLHLSPDCTNFSQAKAGQPRDKRIRSLSWVAISWAGQVKPRAISLENVIEITTWTRLVAKRDPATGRVIKVDGSVAAKGERVPVQEQFLVPDRKRLGATWRRFISILRSMGYEVDWTTIVAADYGAPTQRERLFMVARRDGKPIVWAKPTHSRSGNDGTRTWRAAANCIDWSIASKSIFDRPKPLVTATQKRITRGTVRYVLRNPDPFIVPPAGHAPDRDENAELLAAPTLVQAAYGEGNAGGVKRWGSGVRDIRQPFGTITTSGGFAVATAYLAQMNGGFNETPGRDLRLPMTTITSSGSQQQLVTAHLIHLRGNCDARSLRDPLMTISAGGQHHGVVECRLSPSFEEGALRVADFMLQFPEELGIAPEAVGTLSREEKLALVTVVIGGVAYVIVDIALRMLVPRELYNAQGFPRSYIIDRGHDGRIFSKKAQVRMCGNSVSPIAAAHYLRANFPELIVHDRVKELLAA